MSILTKIQVRIKIVNTKDIQSRIYQNKVSKGFNTTNIEKEFCLIHGELAELYDAYRKKLPTVGEEMADVLWVLLCLANQTGTDLTTELQKSIEKKTNRDSLRHIHNKKLMA